MIYAVAAYSDLSDSAAAGAALAAEIKHGLDGEPDAIIIFASAQHDYITLLSGLASQCRGAKIVGCSSAGEFSSRAAGVGAVSAIAIKSDEIHFSVGLGNGLRKDLDSAVRQMISSFAGQAEHGYRFRTALVFTDALAGYTDELIDKLTIATGGIYQFAGGGAGDDANFASTHVFCGTTVETDAAVILEILSNKPIGIGARHGWKPASAPMRVTEADGMRLISLNGFPAGEVYSEHVASLGSRFDASDPMPHFLHNVIGIDPGNGYKLRVPLSIEADGSMACASDIPAGALVSFMHIEAASASEAAAAAADDAAAQLGEHPLGAALFFDCVATRLRMGDAFAAELTTVQQSIGASVYSGCNTYGQIVRRDGQFSGFHNCTAVVCAFPQ